MAVKQQHGMLETLKKQVLGLKRKEKRTRCQLRMALAKAKKIAKAHAKLTDSIKKKEKSVKKVKRSVR